MTESREIIRTAQLPEHVRIALLTDLRKLFPEAEDAFALQASVSPPAWVEIVLTVLSWSTVFKVAALAYVTQLAKHVADHTWDNRATYRKRIIETIGQPINKLRSFARLFPRTQKEVGRALGVRLGIPGPEYYSTCVSVNSQSEDELLEVAALFVYYLDGISEASRVICGSHGQLVGDYVWCHFVHDGFSLRWYDKDLGRLHQFFAYDGVARTKPLAGWPSDG